MDEVSRDEKLAHFEASTGILDIDECLAILESCNWNVEEAIKCALEGVPQSTSHVESSQEEVEIDEVAQPPVVIGRSIPPHVLQSQLSESTFTTTFTPLSFDDSFETYDDATRPKRMLEFAIQYGDRVFTVTLSDRDTVGTLKEQVRLETGVPVAHQYYHSEWLSASVYPHQSATFPHDDVVLATLQLPKYISCLMFVDPPRDDVAACASSTLPKPATTDSSGASCSSSSPLKRSEPCDRPTVSATASTSGNRNGTKHDLSGTDGSPDSDDDEPLDTDDYCDADDCSPSCDDSVRKKRANERLMPADITDELAAVENFERVFEQRYSIRSVFLVSTVADAIQRAYSGPMSDRRPLAIYLHHDMSVFAHLFCTAVLGRSPVNELLRDRYYVVPCDVTLREHRDRLMSLLSPYLGSVVTSGFRFASADSFPLFLVLARNGRNIELQRAFKAVDVHAPAEFDEFVSYLTATRCQFDEAITADRRIEEQRARREETRREQDEAYSQAAALDAQRLNARAEEIEAQRAREERVASARDRLPPEPSADEPDCVIVKFRHSDGVLTRRFARSSPLQTLVDYLAAEGFCLPDDYNACYGFPKRFLSSAELHRTLSELQFAAQELITLERV